MAINLFKHSPAQLNDQTKDQTITSSTKNSDSFINKINLFLLKLTPIPLGEIIFYSILVHHA